MTTPITVVPVGSSSAALSSSSPAGPPKKAPRKGALKLAFEYAPSGPAAQDRNLLVLLHGLGASLSPLREPLAEVPALAADLATIPPVPPPPRAGDTNQPFFTLGKQLALPSTAVLALQAPLQIPLLDEPAFQFYPSFTLPDFLPEPHPNPSKILADLHAAVDHLTTECGWQPEEIHWLGFGQGGTVACEFALAYGRTHGGKRRFGSVVDVAGPLLSLPTTGLANGTPILALHRPAPASALSTADLAGLRKGFADVQEVRFRGGEGMPRGADEWRVVMAFWAKHLARKDERAMGGGGEMYEVLSGGPKMG